MLESLIDRQWVDDVGWCWVDQVSGLYLHIDGIESIPFRQLTNKLKLFYSEQAFADCESALDYWNTWHGLHASERKQLLEQI
jgi:hypothetical protein